MDMFILYVKDYCPYSARVMREGHEIGVIFEVRNMKDSGIEKELLERGGKHETPYLVDTDRNEEMYDSTVIISYLHEHYAKT